MFKVGDKVSHKITGELGVVKRVDMRRMEYKVIHADGSTSTFNLGRLVAA